MNTLASLQVAAMPVWVGPTIAISLALIALAIVGVAVAAAVAALRLAGHARKIAGMLDGLQDDVAQTLKAARQLTEQAQDLMVVVRHEAGAFAQTSRRLRRRWSAASTGSKGGSRISNRCTTSSTARWRTRPSTSPPPCARYGGGTACSGGCADCWWPAADEGARLALALAGVGLVLLALPQAAHAWTPGTHIYLGESVLANLQVLPSAVADLLRSYPFDFLYGNIAADSSIAKHYAPLGRHCHYWHVGQEIHDLAGSDALRAFALGYLCHLSADSVAHNYFVPRQLTVTSSTAAVGHSYWEARVETHLGDAYSKAAKDVILLDHGEADAHLDRIIAPTIFSVRTNRPPLPRNGAADRKLELATRHPGGPRVQPVAAWKTRTSTGIWDSLSTSWSSSFGARPPRPSCWTPPENGRSRAPRKSGERSCEVVCGAAGNDSSPPRRSTSVSLTARSPSGPSFRPDFPGARRKARLHPPASS